jgi:hypothetical protein
MDLRKLKHGVATPLRASGAPLYICWGRGRRRRLMLGPQIRARTSGRDWTSCKEILRVRAVNMLVWRGSGTPSLGWGQSARGQPKTWIWSGASP